MGSRCCCSSWDLQQTEAEAQPFGLRGSTRSARDTPCLHRVSFPLITLGFLTVLFLWFFFMSAINLLSLMRKHEFPWEESQPVVSHVIGAGAHAGCEGLVAGRVPTDPHKHRHCLWDGCYCGGYAWDAVGFWGCRTLHGHTTYSAIVCRAIC